MVPGFSARKLTQIVPPLPGAEFAQPPAELSAGRFGRRIARQSVKPVGHRVGRHHVFGRQIARVGDVDPIGHRVRRASPWPGR